MFLNKMFTAKAMWKWINVVLSDLEGEVDIAYEGVVYPNPESSS